MAEEQPQAQVQAGSGSAAGGCCETRAECARLAARYRRLRDHTFWALVVSVPGVLFLATIAVLVVLIPGDHTVREIEIGTTVAMVLATLLGISILVGAALTSMAMKREEQYAERARDQDAAGAEDTVGEEAR